MSYCNAVTRSTKERNTVDKVKTLYKIATTRMDSRLSYQPPPGSFLDTNNNGLNLGMFVLSNWTFVDLKYTFDFGTMIFANKDSDLRRLIAELSSEFRGISRSDYTADIISSRQRSREQEDRSPGANYPKHSRFSAMRARTRAPIHAYSSQS
jgi:hypothetical protein